MNQPVLENSPQPRSPLGLKPALAWTAILGLILFSALCILAGAGKILNLVFPAGAVATGFILYFRAPLLYVGFTWWLWFLAPLVRRLADYRGGGFTDPSPILLVPYLVTLIAATTLYHQLPKAARQGGGPFLLALAGVGYAFCVGLLRKSPASVAIGLLDWLSPILFGFHLFIKWRDYPSYRKNLERVFLWGVLLMGAYGIFQYLVAPEWDKFWLVQSGMESSQGKPQALKIRVWSTLNSGEPFSAVMSAGLTLLLASKSPLMVPASIVGYLSFLLSQVRAGWLGWFIGLLSLMSSPSAKFQMRLVITVLVMAVCLVPLVAIEPFSDVIQERLETLTDLENDGSANSRKKTYGLALNAALVSFLGDGIGGSGFDSTVLMLLLHLGWLGTLPYVAGILLLIISLFQNAEGRLDPFISASRAIALGCLARAPFNTMTLEASGIVLWGFLGIGMAGLKYYKHQALSLSYWIAARREQTEPSIEPIYEPVQEE